MRPFSVTVSSLTTSATLPVDQYQEAFNIGLMVDVTGTNTSKVQYTLDDIQDPTVTPTWLDHATLTGLTADAAGTLTIPCRAVRLNVTAFTNGTAKLTVIQTSTK